ncbi:putative ribonuclease H-like domain-containing protein [Tanacetum coccineum]
MVLRTVLTRFGPISLNTARPVNTIQPRTAVNNVGPMENVINNAYPTARMPFHKITAANNSNFTKKVNTVKGTRVNTVRPKAVLSAVKGNKGNVVKASACWVWRPKHKVLDHGNPQQDLKDKGVIDSGCSRHMIGNRSYLTDYKEIDRGFELKFNLFSVSQMCDKKNSVLFTDTECDVLSPDLKLTDESHVLLKVPRKDNMYNVDLKNVIPQGGLTCLFAKATPDESNLWHRRLGHINFKTMNKLNRVMNQFCEMKGIKREFSVARTPQQNGVAERKNRTLIEAVRTMLADSNLPTTFWAEVVNTACYVQNRVLVIKPHNKTPYELFLGRKPALSFMRPFGCPVTILNTINHLGNQSNGSADSKSSPDAEFKPSSDGEKKVDDDQEKDDNVSSTNNINTASDRNNTNNINVVSSTVDAAGIEDKVDDENIVYGCADDPNMLELEDIVYSDDDEDVGAEVDMNNLDAFMLVSPIPTTRIHKDHPVEQIIGDLNSAPQTRRMTKNLKEHEPKKVIHALKDPSWIEAMQDELLQFKLQKNKARLVAQGYTQEDGIDYDEVFAHVARIKAIRLFLAYASFKDFVVYQMDVKSAFLCGKIEEEVYVCQPPGFKDPDFPNRVYKVEKAFYGLHQAPRAWYETLSTYLLDNGFQRGKIDKTLLSEGIKMMHKKFQMCFMGELTFFLGLQVKQKEDGIFISQDKYVIEIVKKFGFTDVKTASTPMETQNPLLKDEDGEEVDVHLYRSMIGSLMYLTSSRPDIMFAVCACTRYQVNPKVSHLHAVKRIFRYLEGQPKLGLWYLKDPPFDLVAYTNSDYAGASLDTKSTTRGCQFLGCRLILW